MKKENISTFGTIALSFLATSCCIGPAIFVVFGSSVGFLGMFSFLAPLQPYFLGAASLMLSYSFWKLYLKKPDCDCTEDVRARKIARVIFWVGVIAVVFAASFQKVVLWIYE